ncbi:hypothetical protein HPB52_018442 [Rhipicephalus sanguineus]|uniref:BPTI/Kunitz inhibitor domain-containing protein n=1 Tax=Rhipicephalus sanguineus TaxID=34632 RepID=A0A9D4STL7_RHISA|nr:hypothetical protein HPB52_018442 [Rhipicephalus sanguineus]
MISTSKIRRPPAVVHDERQKLRRVCFLESSTGNVAEGTVGEIAESTVWKSKEETWPTPRPNDAKYDFQFGSDVNAKAGPAGASASRLFHESRQPSNARLAPGRRPAMTPNFQGTPPQSSPPSGNARVDVLDTVSKAYELRRGDRDERDGSEQPWLQNFGIGVLVAALVAAVITLALTADRPTATVNRKEASTLPRGLEEFSAAGGRRIVASIEARRTAARIGTKVMTRRRTVVVTTASTLRKSETKTQPVPRRHTENQTRPVDRRCGRRFYTYCEQEIREAYYDDRSRSCAWSERDRVRVCNRGANRFRNLGTCLDSCARDPPRERCFESVLLTDCSRRDVVEKWWFFDGARCVHWDFPMGDCPSSRGGRAFRSLRECSVTCLQHTHLRRRRLDGATVPQRSRCLAPLAVTCDPRSIRFPYFADMNAQGSARGPCDYWRAAPADTPKVPETLQHSTTPASAPSAVEPERVETDVVPVGTADTTEGQGETAADSEDEMCVTSATLKRPLDDAGELDGASSTNSQEPPAKAPQGRRLSLKPKPKVPTDRRLADKAKENSAGKQDGPGGG